LVEVKKVDSSRNEFAALPIIIIIIIGAILYFGSQQAETQQGEKSATESITDPESADDNPRQFAGYDCTGVCSGHEAGYRWAEEHDITDGDDCDTAGEHSNSPSFAEGCQAYVDGESPEEPNDPDDDN
jgi:hypothetical protein